MPPNPTNFIVRRGNCEGHVFIRDEKLWKGKPLFEDLPMMAVFPRTILTQPDNGPLVDFGSILDGRKDVPKLLVGSKASIVEAAAVRVGAWRCLWVRGTEREVGWRSA